MTASRYEPHPYALLLPPLTPDEYAALKADIAEHGVLYPAILDEESKILDGVHREKIAAELGIELPVSRHSGLTYERKLHLAVGLNMRRRHLDADRRRELVRRLNTDEGLSLRKIASITGWSKSTIDRDLKTSPFEQAIAVTARLRADMGDVEESDVAGRVLTAMGDGFGALFGWADGQWKRGSWPPPDDNERMVFLLAQYEMSKALDKLIALLEDREPPEPAVTVEWWLGLDPEVRQAKIDKLKSGGYSPGMLRWWNAAGVPSGTLPEGGAA